MSARATPPVVEAIGPYRVEARLGGGGMGEVFKAYDERLDRWVAIKRLLPDRRETERSRERFRREARAAARLNHPAIVHVYDIFQDGEHDCIVLELVEGRSLAALLERGPLDPLAACRLAYSIAEGLGEAHAKGIIHRDLKTENVIVTPSGRPKILDFGLAKPLRRDSDDSSLTGEGHLVGTIRAMAPEQVRGESVDHRADMFSLGVLLYETMTGRSPFAARSAVASLSQLMNARPRPLHELVEGVPPELSTLVETLLAKAPEERPGSADEVALELRRIASRMAGTAAGSAPDTEAGPAPPSRRPRRVRRRLAAAAIAVAVAATIAAFRLREPPRLDFAARDLVVAADFVNATRDPTLGAPLQTAFRVGLEQSPFVRLLSDVERREVLNRMERDPAAAVDRDLGIEICRREGGKALVVGSVLQTGDSEFSLSAEIVEPLKGRTVFIESARAASAAGLLDGVERLTHGLRARLGESLASIAEHGAPLERVTTGDLVALELYSLAVSKSRESDIDAARPLLLEAVARDPEFAMAHAELANLFRRGRRDPLAAERHLDLALRHGDRLTEVERLYIRGWAATWRGPLDPVLEAWSLLTSLHPDESRGHHNLAMARWLYQNRFEEARLGFDAAAAQSVGDLRTISLARRGYCEIALGRAGDAIATFGVVAAGGWFRLGKFDALLAADRLDAAAAELPAWTAAASTEVRHEAELRHAWLALDRGRFADAARIAAHLSRVATRPDLVLAARMARIAALGELGERPTLLAAVREAAEQPLRRLAADPDRALESPLAVLALLGRAAVRAGDLALGRELHAAVARGAAGSGYPIWEAYELTLAGELAAAEGDLAAARGRFAASLERVDTTAAHDGLARVLAASGDARGALAELEWLIAHRGRAVSEGWEVTHETAFDLVGWSLAFARRGTLAEAVGDRPTALRSYRALVERWRDALDHPVRRQAATRLAVLAAGGPAAGTDG